MRRKEGEEGLEGPRGSRRGDKAGREAAGEGEGAWEGTRRRQTRNKGGTGERAGGKWRRNGYVPCYMSSKALN